MNKDHKLYFWHKDNNKTLYMDDDGKVYTIKRIDHINKKPKTYMKTMLMGLIVLLTVLFGMAYTAKADTKTYYTASPAYTELLPEDITFVDNMATAWKDIDALKDVIFIFNHQGHAAANRQFKQYVNLGDAIRVKPGRYPVTYIETYNGFYLFKITVLQTM